MTINYSKQVLVKRGNTSVSSTYTGPLGEITYDTGLNTLRVHDGAQLGGYLIASYAQLSSEFELDGGNAFTNYTAELDVDGGDANG
jgi:hypothetical protein